MGIVTTLAYNTHYLHDTEKAETLHTMATPAVKGAAAPTAVAVYDFTFLPKPLSVQHARMFARLYEQATAEFFALPPNKRTQAAWEQMVVKYGEKALNRSAQVKGYKARNKNAAKASSFGK